MRLACAHPCAWWEVSQAGGAEEGLRSRTTRLSWAVRRSCSEVDSVTPAARRRASEVDSAVAELDSLAKQGLREKEAGTDLDPCQQLREGRRRRRPRKSRSAVGSAGGSGLADGRARPQWRQPGEGLDFFCLRRLHRCCWRPDFLLRLGCYCACCKMTFASPILHCIVRLSPRPID
jgi:hypothetical protein